MDLIRKMPKIDLHLHLDGCVKPSTLLELAAAQHRILPAPDAPGLLPYMQVEEECRSLTEYLQKFDFVLPYLQNGEALERVAYEVTEQAAADNVCYVECRFAPMLHTLEGLSAADAVGHVVQGLQRGERDFGVKARAIVICLRSHDESANREALAAAVRYAGSGVAAVDLAGDEASFPPSLFRSLFEDARRSGLPVTIHAGEAAGPENVEEAVMRLGAVRIGHGVRAREDEAVIAMLKDQRIPLEMCPVSNLQTKAVSSWNDYPIRQYMEQGLLVTVNTDNPTVSGTTMSKEFSMLSKHFGFTAEELVRLVANSIEAAFLEPAEKEELRQTVAGHMAALGLSLPG
ncbi:adenosine deaminase [Paenibacillus sambharensis]|uniref:Adenosine deaminase n=1 Tax=Paenibacillus sambharensis TaxID=1803190 RepID=A0A2W1M1Y4_9BACL|nr:adenosine deaminase [Paenibacillus sambharensis]PZD97657.1 adenosine deaminase [Paenibacillus sambharensis]